MDDHRNFALSQKPAPESPDCSSNRPVTCRDLPKSHSLRRRDFASMAISTGTYMAIQPLNASSNDASQPPAGTNVTQLRVRPRYHRWHVNRGVDWMESNTDYAYLDWTLPLEQTALILVDVWDHHYLRDTEDRAEKIIDEKLAPLLACCRQARMPIIHAPSPPHACKHPNWIGPSTTSKPTLQDATWPPPEFRTKAGSYASYRRPTEARETELASLRAKLNIHPKVQPVQNEPVVATGDELHEYCKKQGILFLFFAGFNTNACILVRDYGTLEMSRRGYEVLLVRDCTTGMESRHSQPTMSQTQGAILFLEMFGQYSVSSHDLCDGLR